MSVHYPPPRPLPLGVALLAILIGLFGVLLLIIGLAVVALAGLASLASALGVFGLVGILAGLFLLLLGGILLAVALGLWHQQLWALVLCFLVVGLFVVSDVLSGNYSWGFLIDLVLLVYLAVVSRDFW